MNVEEIQAALGELVRAMLDKGVVRPEATFGLRADTRPHVCLNGSEKSLGGDNYVWFHDDVPKSAITAARVFIAGLENAETAVMRTYLGKLADAVDYGHANGIAAEYVDPVRITQKAMSDNLLTVTT